MFYACIFIGILMLNSYPHPHRRTEASIHDIPASIDARRHSPVQHRLSKARDAQAHEDGRRSTRGGNPLSACQGHPPLAATIVDSVEGWFGGNKKYRSMRSRATRRHLPRALVLVKSQGRWVFIRRQQGWPGFEAKGSIAASSWRQCESVKLKFPTRSCIVF